MGHFPGAELGFFSMETSERQHLCFLGLNKKDIKELDLLFAPISLCAKLTGCWRSFLLYKHGFISPPK